MTHREELIKRIDAWFDFRKPKSAAGDVINHDCPRDEFAAELLADCRAEIERITSALKDSQALNLKFAQDREAADAKIERLNKPVRYVPMTEKQRAQWWSSDWSNGVMLWKFERAVIRRAIVQGAKLEVME